MTLELSLTVERGDFRLALDVACEGVTAVMGPNGAGKTTLLRTCVGALRPRTGRIVLDGRTLFDAYGRDLPPEARRIAYVPQGLGLFPHLSVLDNVVFGRRHGSPPQRRLASRRLLEELDVAHLAERWPSELSGGEQQKVALARAMATDPELLLLDEPLAALDPTARPRLRRSLAIWLAETDLPALLVTHDPLDAQELADELLVLEGGEVTQHGSIDDVAVRPSTEFVAALSAGLIDRRPRSVPPPTMISEDE